MENIDILLERWAAFLLEWKLEGEKIMPKYIPSLGVSKFTELDDAPKSYSGQGGKVPTVKSTEDGLEFSVIPTPYSPGNVTLLSAPTTKAITSTTPEKAKEVVIQRAGGYRIYFEVYVNTTQGRAQIYRNDQPYGTLRSPPPNVWVGYTEDLSGFVEGDKIQLYVWDTLNRGVWVRNFTVMVNILKENRVTLD